MGSLEFTYSLKQVFLKTVKLMGKSEPRFSRDCAGTCRCFPYSVPTRSRNRAPWLAYSVREPRSHHESIAQSLFLGTRFETSNHRLLGRRSSNGERIDLCEPRLEHSE